MGYRIRAATVASYDNSTLAPTRFLGDLAVLYPSLAIPLTIGGLVQSVITVLVVRAVRERRRLTAMLLAPLAFAPMVVFGLVDVGALYLAVPMALACMLYVVLVTPPPATVSTA